MCFRRIIEIGELLKTFFTIEDISVHFEISKSMVKKGRQELRQLALSRNNE